MTPVTARGSHCDLAEYCGVTRDLSGSTGSRKAPAGRQVASQQSIIRWDHEPIDEPLTRASVPSCGRLAALVGLALRNEGDALDLRVAQRVHGVHDRRVLRGLIALHVHQLPFLFSLAVESSTTFPLLSFSWSLKSARMS